MRTPISRRLTQGGWTVICSGASDKTSFPGALGPSPWRNSRPRPKDRGWRAHASGVTASLGHASLRVPGQPDRFVVKGRGYKMDALAAMRPEDMVVCNIEGSFIEGPPGSMQCFEVNMHSCIYKLYGPNYPATRTR
jgi:Class II Aldolase and Adducin N-terminal domain